VLIGDQIQISGMLAKYKNNQGFNRGTSITRTDTGNGACETIYVNDFQITQPSKNAWRKVYTITLVSLLLSIGWWLLGIARE
jgi:hypothetical protein